MQVISVEYGDAESSDGIHWVLYVNHKDIVAHTGMFEVRYGSWNRHDGLSLSMVRGTEQNKLIETVGDNLVMALQQHAGEIPFRGIDDHECWLLTTDDMPLALMDSVTEPSGRYVFESPSWHPGASAYEAFDSDFGDAASLRELVRLRAGRKQKSIWLHRQQDLSGITEDGQTFSGEQIPKFLLNEHWGEESDRKLVEDYFRWQAPWLLQLDSLSDAQRGDYEKYAWRRQLVCANQFQLFPRVVDERALRSVRVQAQLMGSDTRGVNVREAFVHSGDKESYSP